MSERSENLAYAAQLLADSGHRKNGPLYAGVMLSNGSIMILEIRSRRQARQPASRRLEEAVKSRGFGFASCTSKGEIFSSLGACGALRSTALTVEFAEAAE